MGSFIGAMALIKRSPAAEMRQKESGCMLGHPSTHTWKRYNQGEVVANKGSEGDAEAEADAKADAEGSRL